MIMSKLEDTYHRILKLKRAKLKEAEVAREQEATKARLTEADNKAAAERLAKVMNRVRASETLVVSRVARTVVVNE